MLEKDKQNIFDIKEALENRENIIAHDYFGIDAEEIWQIVKNILPPFYDQINNILLKEWGIK